MKNPIKGAFSGWKIIFAIIIGVSISIFMVYRSVSKVQFIENRAGSGEYIWTDGNQNGKIDVHDHSDFELSSNGNYTRESVSNTLAQINWTFTSFLWLLASLVFMFGRDLFYIIRIRLLTNNRLSWESGFFVIMLWEFASALSPGVVGGSAVAMFILNREKIPLGKATAIVIVTLFMDNLFFVFMIPFVFLVIGPEILFPSAEAGSTALSWWFWGGFTVITTLCLFLFLSIFRFPKLATQFLVIIFRLPFLKRWSSAAQKWGKDIEIASHEFKTASLVFWFRVFFTTLISWTSRYLVINALLNAFVSLSFQDNILILGKQLILWLFMLVTPTPGGSGVAEFAFGELLSTFSSSALLLTGIAVLWRLVSYFPYLFIGSIILPVWLRRTR